MRKFLGTLAILLLVIGALGYFRGWFNISTSDQPGNTNIELQIDKEKIQQDAEKVKEKAQGLASQAEGNEPAANPEQ